MIGLNVDLLVDALTLVLHTSDAHPRQLVQRLLEIYDLEDRETKLNDNEFCQLYVDLIREVMATELQLTDTSAVETCLLKFKSNPTVIKDPELYTTLRKIFSSDAYFSKERQNYLEHKISNAIVWYSNTKYAKKIFGKLAFTSNDPERQDEILREISELCNNIIHNNDTVTSESEENNSQVRYLDFQNRDTMKRALTAYQTVTVNNKFVTGFQALNRALGGGFPLGSSIVINARSYNGKALRNGTPVRIPDGWCPIEQLHVGDEVIGQDGMPTKVLGVYPQGKRALMQVTFEDGRQIDVDRDHLWGVLIDDDFDYVNQGYVIPTHELASQLPAHRIYVPLPESERGMDKSLPFDPYALGVILAAGSVWDDDLPEQLGICVTDIQIIHNISQWLPDGCRVHPYYDYKISSWIGMFYSDPGYMTLNRILRRLKVIRSSGYHPNIPERYLEASYSQRLSLMQGLLDARGEVTDQGIDFRTISKDLAESVQKLAWSLGAICYITYEVITREYHLTIRHIRISSFVTQPMKVRTLDVLMHHAQAANRLQIISIVELPEQDDATCIRVDNENALFVTKDYIVTHNTMMLLKFARWQITLNRPSSEFSNPTCLFYSLENETPQNFMLLFKDLYIQRYKKLPPDNIPDDEIINFCHQEFNRYGWKLIIDRRLGAEFGFPELVANFEGYKRMGFTPLMCIIDYANMMAKGSGDVSESSTNNLKIKELYTNLCNYLKSQNCTFITAHQLNRRADEVVRQNPVGAVKRFGPDMLADSISVQREVDIVLYQNKELDSAGNAYMTFKLDKNRYNSIIPDKDKYFAYPFYGPLGLIDDLDTADGSTSNLYAFPFQDKLNEVIAQGDPEATQQESTSQDTSVETADADLFN